MPWEKPVSQRSAASAWRDDFPLSRDLPEHLALDLDWLRLPIHPMFALRLRAFLDWHRAAGRTVDLRLPRDQATKDAFCAMQIDPRLAETSSSDLILPATAIREFSDVEVAASRAREITEYERRDIAVLGNAIFMAVSELCDNAIEHGENAHGAYVAVGLRTEPRRQVSIAISDLGIGIPEHLRQHFPDWADDEFAIARAVEPHVSGTGDPHRGNGYSEVFDAALTRSLHAARIEIHSAGGFLRTQIVQERRAVEPFPAARYKRGTWISYELVSV